MAVRSPDLQSIVTAHTKCKTSSAKYLSIFDFEYKATCDGEYDIGGTYKDVPDYWFMYRTQTFIKHQYLVNLFVCNRQAGTFSVTVGDSYRRVDKDTRNNDKVYLDFSEHPQKYDFYNTPANTFSLVRSFKFSQEELDSIHGRDLLIEIKIEADHIIFSEYVKDDVKLNHSFGMLLADNEGSDVTLESCDDCKLSAHKIILSAYSPVLRKMLEASPSVLKLTDTVSDISLILQFMYTGTLENFKEKDCIRIINLGIKYDIRGLIQLTQHILKDQVNVDNAVDILMLAHAQDLNLLREVVFSFIKENQAVFQSQSWANLKDLELTKQLFQYIVS